MEKRVKGKVNDWISTFKGDIKSHLSINKEQLENKKGDDVIQFILQYIYDYNPLTLEDTDFQKRKRVKNTVPYFERCKALRANGEQCTRRKKTNEDGSSSCDFCGTHMKGTPHGIVTSSNSSVENVKTVHTWAQDFNGIVYYIDKDHNVYAPEDVYQNKKNPNIIAKYEIDSEGNYIIPSLFAQ